MSEENAAQDVPAETQAEKDAADAKATSYNKARLKIMWPFGAAIVLGATQPFFDEGQELYAGIVRWVGLGSLGLGTFIRLWCLGHLRKKERLSVSGPYAHSRNPLYVGTFFILGGALLASNWIMGLALIVPYLFTFHYVYSRQIRWEEFRLAPIFGQDYQDYLEGAPRFWPSIKAYEKRAKDQKFSLGLLFKNHALDLMLGVAALLLVMDLMGGVVWPMILDGGEIGEMLRARYLSGFGG